MALKFLCSQARVFTLLLCFVLNLAGCFPELPAFNMEEENCTEGDLRACAPVGECQATQICTEASGWGTCEVAIEQATEEVPDGLDNDCDGQVDENLEEPEEVCDGQDNDADGQVDEGFDLQNDAANCGACGRVCVFDHAVSVCSEGECGIVSCEEGFFNEDQILENGCELGCENDENSAFRLDGIELMDGLDNDCDENIDETPPLLRFAGNQHMCFRLQNGGVKCWGSNRGGKLGYGDEENRSDDPNERVINLPAVDLGMAPDGSPYRVQSITASESTTCALLHNSDIKCWGSNYYGNIGIGDLEPRGDGPGEMGNALPVTQLGLNDAEHRPLYIESMGESFYVFTASGQIKSWGYNRFGQLGLEDDLDRGDQLEELGGALPFVNLGEGRRVVEVSSGLSHACALLDNGLVKCWGYNGFGQLGLGDEENRGDEPGEMGDALLYVDIADQPIVSIAGGIHANCAILEDGRVKCWGYNTYGQLGYGDEEHRGNAPGEMGGALPFVDLGTNQRAVALGMGRSHVCALLNGGQIKCWGSNGFGQLGLGDLQDRGDEAGEMGDALPFVDLGQDETAISISVGDNHTCALLRSGGLKCWGGNRDGQLGLGDIESRGSAPGEMGDALPVILVE